MPLLVAVVISMMGSYNPSLLSVPIVEAAPIQIPDLQNIALEDAKKYNLNAQHFFKVINCESGWSATSTGPTGDYGITQINQKAHPDITKDEMFDPVWSLNWMAQQWSEGHASLWVCYNLIYGKNL